MKAVSGKLTRERIMAVYQDGPEAVVTLVEQLQIDITSLNARVANLETRANYEHLLLCLNRDRDQAEQEYEHLLNALKRYLIHLGAEDPEGIASDTLGELSNQVGADKISATLADLRQYARGIARNLHRDAMKERKRIHGSFDDPNYDKTNTLKAPSTIELLERVEQEEEERKARTECMRSCYGQLTEDERRMLALYSQEEAHSKERRENLAKELGLKLETLRVYVHRSRKQLKKCCSACLKKLDLECNKACF